MSPSPCTHLIASLLTCTLFLAPAGCREKANPASRTPSASDSPLVGTWALIGGDYPLTDEYRADGTFVQRIGSRATEPHPFRVEGEYLIVSIAQFDGRITEQRDRFALNADTLTFFAPDGSKRVFRRRN